MNLNTTHAELERLAELSAETRRQVSNETEIYGGQPVYSSTECLLVACDGLDSLIADHRELLAEVAGVVAEANRLRAQLATAERRLRGAKRVIDDKLERHSDLISLTCYEQYRVGEREFPTLDAALDAIGGEE